MDQLRVNTEELQDTARRLLRAAYSLQDLRQELGSAMSHLSTVHTRTAERYTEDIRRARKMDGRIADDMESLARALSQVADRFATLERGLENKAGGISTGPEDMSQVAYDVYPGGQHAGSALREKTITWGHPWSGSRGQRSSAMLPEGFPLAAGADVTPLSAAAALDNPLPGRSAAYEWLQDLALG